MARNKKKNYGIDIGGNDTKQLASPVSPSSDDGAVQVMGVNSYFGSTYINMDAGNSNEQELIKRYRTLSNYSEIDLAIDNIINESIVYDTDVAPIKLNLDKLPLSKTMKMKIFEQFERILDLLRFDEKSYAIYRRWYIDGRLYFNVIIDQANPGLGIQELRPIDALRIKKVRELVKEKDENGVDFIKQTNEFYLYSESGFMAGTSQNINSNNTQGIKFNVDAILSCTSGVIDETTKQTLSHLHKAIRPANQLRMLEDAVIIYKISRAPERRIFYIDVGNLPKTKAEEHLRDVMNRYRNKVVYDGVNGEVKDDKKFMSMLEDFWMPRKEGSRGTEITTLPGASASFNDMVDVGYFQGKLFNALNVPISRLQSQSGFNMGRSSEITRDELNFMKFVHRLQKRFSFLFLDALKIQLILTGIISEPDWDFIRNKIIIQYEADNYFEELKFQEILTARIQTAMALEPYVGKYFSHDFVRRQIFKQTEEEIDELDNMIVGEFANQIYYPPQATSDMMDDGTSADDTQDDGPAGSSSPSGDSSKMTLADIEHTMSKTMLQVMAGKVIQVTKKGKVIAKITPVRESLDEDFDVIKISMIESVESLLDVMADGETMILSENGSKFIKLIKV